MNMPYNYREIEKRLLKLWYRIVRQKWSHVIFVKSWEIIPVPNHWWKGISPWVENKILKILKLERKDFDAIK